MANIGQMLGANNLKVTPAILARACAVDEFKGLWAGLENFTTGLSVISEVARYGARFKPVFDPLKEKPFTPALIRTAHRPPRRGETVTAYRTSLSKLEIMQGESVIGALETGHPDDIEGLMDKLVGWLESSLEKKEQHPLLLIGIFTAVFLQISPFEENNMKTARFLLLLLMLRSGYSYAPYIPVDRYMDARAKQVFEALQYTQQSLESGKPDWSPWLECFFGILNDQAQTLRGRISGNNNQLEPAQMPPLSARVVKLFEYHDQLQMKQIITLTGGRRSTLKLRLNELVESGYLRRHGDKRSTWYARV